MLCKNGLKVKKKSSTLYLKTRQEIITKYKENKMSQKTIVHIGTLYAKPEFAKALIESFEGLKQAPGYISYECFRDIEDQNKLTLVERWESKSDHENFVNSFPEVVMEQWLDMISQRGEDSYYQEV